MKSIGIYIHFPYCIHKCSYCDFFSVSDLSTIDKMADAIAQEIIIRANETDMSSLNVRSIFIGGGTPSLMKPHHLEKIINNIASVSSLSNLEEFTLECNPGAVDLRHFADYKSMGVNRISFGMQSFNEEELKFLERIHSPNEITLSVEQARRIGFDNISIDLIYAIPVQTIDSWKYTLSRLNELEPNHFSAYSLIYEEGTPLHYKHSKGRIKAIDDETDYRMYEVLSDFAQNNGYEQYEVSNFAKDGKYCLHNINYWETGEYLAYGPSAHGYISGRRYWNKRKVTAYIMNIKNNQLAEESSEILSKTDKLNEVILLGLRARGLNIDFLKNEYGVDLNQISLIQALLSSGKIILSKGYFRLSKEGYFTADEIAIALANSIDEILKSYTNSYLKLDDKVVYL